MNVGIVLEQPLQTFVLYIYDGAGKKIERLTIWA